MRIALSDVVIVSVTFLILGLGSYWVQCGMAWYVQLRKPAITPPDWIFSVAWTVIYVCTALCAALVWRTNLLGWRLYVITILFLLNALANMAWTYLFFVRHSALLALGDAFILFVSTWLLLGLLMPFCVTCAWLLLPYGLWLCLALYLNWQILMLNISLFF